MMIQSKKGFSTQSWVIGLILFSAVIAMYVLMVAEQATLYDNEEIIDEQILENYNKISDSTGIVQDAFESATDTGGLSLVGTFDVLFSSSFTVISLVFNSIPLMTSITASFATDFGIPSEIASIIFPTFLAIITIIIIYRVINSTTRAPI